MVFVPVEEVLQSFALAEDQSEDGRRFAVLEVEVSIVVAAAVEVAVEYVSAVIAIVVAAEQSRSNR